MYNFSDILGQDTVKQHFTAAVASDRVSHAYMLTGEAGMGKGALADAFAAMLLCERDHLHPCGVCHACRQVSADTHPDLIRVTHEKPNSISVDEVREQICAEAVIRPFSGKKRVFIVPEAEKMTPQAQNALLKTIEEPPEYVVILSGDHLYMMDYSKMLDEHKAIMMHLWNSKWRYDILNSLADHVNPIIINGINECEAQAGLTIPEEDKKMIAGLYQDIFMGLIKRYMRERMEQDPEKLLTIYGAILEKDTSYGLRRISELKKQAK